MSHVWRNHCSSAQHKFDFWSKRCRNGVSGNHIQVHIQFNTRPMFFVVNIKSYLNWLQLHLLFLKIDLQEIILSFNFRLVWYEKSCQRDPNFVLGVVFYTWTHNACIGIWLSRRGWRHFLSSFLRVSEISWQASSIGSAFLC